MEWMSKRLQVYSLLKAKEGARCWEHHREWWYFLPGKLGVSIILQSRQENSLVTCMERFILVINLQGHGKIERVSALRSLQVPVKEIQVHNLKFAELTITTSSHVLVCERPRDLPMCCDKLRYLVSNLSFSAPEHCAELVLFSEKSKYTVFYNLFIWTKKIHRQSSYIHSIYTETIF